MSRNASGTYTLPSGNPVVAGTLIEASWANTTLSDLATAMTDSLSRSGQGGMTAALRLFDGTSSVPGLAWGSETTTGWYRAGAGDMRLVVTGSEVMKYLSTGVTVTGTFGVSGAVTLSSTLAVTGATTFTANPTLSGGTANGVAYLNGSKVVTTGTALTFDGTTLKASLGSSGATAVSNGNTLVLENSAAVGMSLLTPDANASRIYFGTASNNRNAFIYSDYNSGAQTLIFGLGSGATAAIEQMRLTSTGLGIGTSSPGYKLAVQGSAYITSTVGIGNTPGNYGGQVEIYTNANSANNGIWVRNDSTGSSAKAGIVLNASGNSWRMSMGSTANNSNALTWELDVSAPSTKMTLDSSGNLGLGVTPSAWGGFKAFQIGAGSSLAGWASDAGTELSSNAYYGSSAWRYIASAIATRYQITATGENRWYTAPSGTAGNAITFTQAMTLDASGNLLVGGSSSDLSARVMCIGSSGLAVQYAGTTGTYLNIVPGAANGTVDLKFDARSGAYPAATFWTGNTERARIDSSGTLLVGKTSSDATVSGCELSSTGGVFTRAGDALLVNRQGSDGTAITIRRSNTTVGTISVTTTATAYNTSSDYRLKNIDGPLTGSGSFIDALKPKVGTWKADGSKFVGFLAHEVQEVSPGSVVGEKDGEQMQAMEYGSAEFIANIIAELQSLRARVAQLEGQ